MKRLIAAVLAILTLFCPAMAEEMIAFEDFSKALNALYEGEWKEKGDFRTLTLEAGAMISVCLSGEDVAAVTVETARDGSLPEIARSVLECLNVLSEETLDKIETLEGDAQLIAEEFAIDHVLGETRECIAIAAEADHDSLFWEPVHGGDQLHSKPDCSGMDVPRLITPEAAALTGYDLCDHCARSSSEE